MFYQSAPSPPRGEGWGEGLLSQRAKALRQGQTEAKKFLWYMLRSRQMGGLKFRRQHPLDPFIVDFVCLERRLIVELDGGQHAIDIQADKLREHYLENQGYRVLRFWNHEVLTNVEGVLARIMEELMRTPSPCPLPQGGEEIKGNGDKG